MRGAPEDAADAPLEHSRPGTAVTDSILKQYFLVPKMVNIYSELSHIVRGAGTVGGVVASGPSEFSPFD